MGAFSKTVTNQLNLFGIDNPNKWGTVLWNQKWGSGNNDLKVIVGKIIGNTLALSDLVIPKVTFQRFVTNILVLTGDLSGEMIQDPQGYFLVFGTSTNAENRPLTGYTSISDTDVTYTTAVNTTTTWTVI